MRNIRKNSIPFHWITILEPLSHTVYMINRGTNQFRYVRDSNFFNHWPHQIHRNSLNTLLLFHSVTCFWADPKTVRERNKQKTEKKMAFAQFTEFVKCFSCLRMKKIQFNLKLKRIQRMVISIEKCENSLNANQLEVGFLYFLFRAMNR